MFQYNKINIFSILTLYPSIPQSLSEGFSELKGGEMRIPNRSNLFKEESLL